MQVATSRSQVCQRLRYMRVLAPVSALVLVLAQQVFEHTVLMGLTTFRYGPSLARVVATTVPKGVACSLISMTRPRAPVRRKFRFTRIQPRPRSWRRGMRPTARP